MKFKVGDEVEWQPVAQPLTRGVVVDVDPTTGFVKVEYGPWDDRGWVEERHLKLRGEGQQ